MKPLQENPGQFNSLATPYREGLIGNQQGVGFHGTIAVCRGLSGNEPHFAVGVDGREARVASRYACKFDALTSIGILRHALTRLRLLGRTLLLPLALALLGVVGTPLASGMDYFVRPEGNDSEAGTSRTAAWATIERANRAPLKPGDRLLFEAGGAFFGNIHLTEAQSGTPQAPVTIGSFGLGRAVISAGLGTGVLVENAGGIIIRDLIVVGAGRTNNLGYGVRCENRRKDGRRLEFLRIENLDAGGFGMFGILISGDSAGYEDVKVLGCALHDNLRAGMEIAGRLPVEATHYAHALVEVRDCEAYANTGDPAFLKNHSGSGIVLYQVDGGLIDHCAAWNNGGECHNKAGGGVGLWTCASRSVVIQHCESFANRTQGADGGGFDIDGGCIGCVLQNNYSHDNAGPGLMVYSYPYAAYSDRDNIVRFNVSENDSRKSRTYAGLYVHSYGPRMTGLRIYNNTVISGAWTDQAAVVHGEGVEAVFLNNIFASAEGSVPLRVFDPSPTLRFESNLYASEGGSAAVVWGGERFSSMEGWRKATGQELVGARATGIWSLPALAGHASDFHPFARADISEWRAFRPRRGSPAIKAGLNLTAWSGAGARAIDLGGNRLPGKGPWPVGAVMP